MEGKKEQNDLNSETMKLCLLRCSKMLHFAVLQNVVVLRVRGLHKELQIIRQPKGVVAFIASNMV